MKKFKNIVYIETALGGNLHDDTIDKLISDNKYGRYEPRDPKLTSEEVSDIPEISKELYFPCNLFRRWM